MTENKPRLLDQVREIIRVKHYSSRTEESYINWIKRFIFFHNKKQPIEMEEKDRSTINFKNNKQLTINKQHRLGSY